MKLLKYLSVCVLITIIACDKVKKPIVPKEEAVGTNFITKSNASVSNFRKVLLEDYTGHQCGNCPAAAIVANDLYAQNNGSVVVLAVHAGFFSKTNSNYPTSYTTSVGNDWDGSTGFGISSAGNPNGMINRKNFPGDGRIQKETKWATSVATALAEPFMIKLDLTTNYDPTARALNTDIKGTFKANYTNSTKLSIVFYEDSVIGPQKDYSQNPDKVPNYKFEHMLRGSINGSWGVDFKAGPIAINDTARISYKNFPLDAKFNDKHVAVVAFVYDAVTREVLQVEKVKIR
jgi:thiol-disulfide isomerase/thioredoxin